MTKPDFDEKITEKMTICILAAEGQLKKLADQIGLTDRTELKHRSDFEWARLSFYCAFSGTFGIVSCLGLLWAIFGG